MQPLRTMNTQLPFEKLFAGDPDPIGQPLTGEQLRDSGIASVINHTPEVYRSRFIDTVKAFPRGRLFTVEDVREVAGNPPPESHYNVMGGLMRTAMSQKLIVRTAERRKAKRPSLHASEIAVWRRV